MPQQSFFVTKKWVQENIENVSFAFLGELNLIPNQTVTVQIHQLHHFVSLISLSGVISHHHQSFCCKVQMLFKYNLKTF